MIKEHSLTAAFAHVAFAFCAVAASPVNAVIVQVGSPASLAADDRIHWGQLVPGNTAAAYLAPVSVVSDGGRGAAVANITGPRHSFVADVGRSPFIPGGNDPNDSTLSNCCNFNPPFYYGDLTITFATAVRGVGAFVGGGGATWDVFLNVNDDPTLNFRVSGDRLTDASSRTFPFLSVVSDDLDIRSIRFTSTTPSDSFGFITIDDLQLLTTAVPPPPPSPMPEPSSWAMMIAGFGLAGSNWRRRGKPSVEPLRDRQRSS